MSQSESQWLILNWNIECCTVLRLRFEMTPGGVLVESQSVLSTRYGSLSIGLLRESQDFYILRHSSPGGKISACHLLPSCHHDIIDHDHTITITVPCLLA